MSDFTNTYEDRVVNKVLRNTDYTSDATVYVALFTAFADTENGTGTEVTGGSYARQAVTFSAPSNGATSNSGAVTFTNMPTATITHLALTNHVTNNANTDMVMVKAFSKSTSSGETLTFAIGDIDVTVA
jgi:hypothetical protein